MYSLPFLSVVLIFLSSELQTKNLENFENFPVERIAGQLYCTGV